MADDPNPAPAPADPAPAPAPTPAPNPDPAPTPAPTPAPAPADPKPTPDPAPAPAPAPAEPDPLDTDITKVGQTEEAKKQEAKEKADEAFKGYLAAAGFKDGPEDIVIQKGADGEPDVTIPARQAGAILHAMQKAGMDAAGAKKAIGLVAAVEEVRAKEAGESYTRALRAVREDTRKEFGDSLAAASRDMVAGGVALFGAEYWQQLCQEPLLTNDKRFVRALASYGARLRNDNGGPPPASAGARDGAAITADQWAARWAKSSR